MTEDNRKDALLWDTRTHYWLQILQGTSTLDEIVSQLVRVLPWRVAAVYRIFEAQNLVIAQASKGYEPLQRDRIEFTLLPENNIVSYSYLRRETIRLVSPADWNSYHLGQASRTIIEQLQIEQAVAVPLIHGGQVVGVIYIADHLNSTEDLSEEAVHALELVAPTVAAMISKQELLEMTERENQALHWIQNVSRVLLLVKSEEELWRQFRDMLIQFGSVRAGVFVHNQGGQWAIVEHFGTSPVYSERITLNTQSWVHEQLEELPLDGSVGLIEWFTPTDRTWSSQAETVEPSTQKGVRSYLMKDGSVVGVMVLYFSKVEPYVERVLPSLLHIFSLSLELMNQREELQLFGVKDALTGAWNRRALEARMEKYFRTANTSNAVFILLDFNGFKKLNDTRGHQVGDEVLKEFAWWLSEELGAGSFVARLGGDEFVILLPEQKFAAHFYHEFTTFIAKSPLTRHGLSAAIGVVDIPREAETFTSCYRLADERMYASKQSKKGYAVSPILAVLWKLMRVK